LNIQQLIKEAKMFGSSACDEGRHVWESEGGRTCPKYENAGCSQTVYMCLHCGAYDYGDKGGPAHRECFIECRRDFSDEIAEDAEYAAECARTTASDALHATESIRPLITHLIGSDNP